MTHFTFFVFLTKAGGVSEIITTARVLEKKNMSNMRHECMNYKRFPNIYIKTKPKYY